MDEISHQFTVCFQGDEVELNNGFDVAVIELTKKDVNMRISSDSDTDPLWGVVKQTFSLVSITHWTVTRSRPPFPRSSLSPSSRPRAEGGLQVQIQVRTHTFVFVSCSSLSICHSLAHGA